MRMANEKWQMRKEKSKMRNENEKWEMTNDKWEMSMRNEKWEMRMRMTNEKRINNHSLK